MTEFQSESETELKVETVSKNNMSLIRMEGGERGGDQRVIWDIEINIRSNVCYYTVTTSLFSLSQLERSRWKVALFGKKTEASY